MENYKSSHDVEYDYRKIDSETIISHIKKLRKRYPNDQEFGNAVSKWIDNYSNPKIFPGIQNL